MMKIITTHIDKGGTGKTTICYNFSKWLTDVMGKKVLLVDGDHSQNLSFSFPGADGDSVYDLFEGKHVEFTHITSNLDLLKGSELLKEGSLDLKSRQNNTMIFFMWIADNYDRLNEYDYIVIDTHNDKSLITYNFLAVSDIILGISEPSRNGFRAWYELNETINELKDTVIDPISRKSYITGTPYLIGNKIEHIGNSSKQFLERVEVEDNYLGMIQKKELMVKSLLQNQSIFEMKNEMSDREFAKHKGFYENIESLFTNVINTIN